MKAAVSSVDTVCKVVFQTDTRLKMMDQLIALGLPCVGWGWGVGVNPIHRRVCVWVEVGATGVVCMPQFRFCLSVFIVCDRHP